MSSSLRKKEIIFRTIEPPNTTTCQPHTLWIAHLLQDILVPPPEDQPQHNSFSISQLNHYCVCNYSLH
ncbi:hypothetical protein AMECASPLE_009367 [Ameca splendens]|uniref:Uncharacterized protein n=1 Tax=Ameca splendens TaxID=208324 RepID=A0ABV0ZKL0_9TELE